MIELDDALRQLPLAAILRGLRPEQALAIGEVLVEAGFSIIEVPLNSPDPLASIGLLARQFGERTLIGAGTVTGAGEVSAVAAVGGRLIVMPHFDPEVVAATRAAGVYCMPGVTTPGEAFTALRAGVDTLKLFPAEMLTPPVVKAMRSVLPPEARLFPVGGITPETMAPYWAVGVAGFGLGSALFRKGSSAEAVRTRAQAFVKAFRALRG